MFHAILLLEYIHRMVKPFGELYPINPKPLQPVVLGL